MRSNAKLALAAVIGAAAGVLFSRRRRPVEAPAAPDGRAEELRQKLAEAKAAVADETDFEAAGMGAETLVEEPAPTGPPLDYVQEPPPAETPPPEPQAKQRKKPAAPAEPPPADEFEAMRRRIHEEGRTAAEEMRRSAEKPDQA